LTLDNSLVQTLISGVLAAGNGWLHTRHKSLLSQHVAMQLKLAELKADLRVEVAERKGLSEDIARVEAALGSVNQKLDRLLQSRTKN
jgi:hypothetical protein